MPGPTLAGGCPDEQPNGPAANLGTREGDFLPEPPLPWAVQVPLLQETKKMASRSPRGEKPLRFLLGLGDSHGHGGLAAMVGKGTAGRRRDSASHTQAGLQLGRFARWAPSSQLRPDPQAV